MLFDFSSEQYAFRDSVRDALASTASASALRAIWDSPDLGAPAAWSALADLGLFAIAVPEDHGGLGASPLDLTLALEELGYAALPEPAAETALIAPMVLRACSDNAPIAELLRGMVDGKAKIAVASGNTLVPYAVGADAIISIKDCHVYLTPATEVKMTPVETMDPSLRVALCELSLPPGTMLTDDPTLAARAASVAAVATAMTLVGLSRRMLEMTRDYALERKQFDRVIGSFQAIKHRLADVAVSIEAARGLSWRAGLALAAEPDIGVVAHIAKSAANEAAYAAGAAALQIHGGIGFTWEHDLHLWMQRSKALEVLHGSTECHRLAIGRRVLDGSIGSTAEVSM